MQKVTVHSKVVNGRLASNRGVLADAIAAFEGKTVSVTVERKKNKRTNQQNRWYWKCAVELVRLQLLSLGHRFTAQETHEALKQWVADSAPDVLVSEVVIESTGQCLPRIKSTTELTTTEFMAFKEALQQWCVENLNLVIPDPDEQIEFNY